MFNKVILFSLALSFSVLSIAADCPFNKPYSRSEKCLCKGIKDVDANNMLVCKTQETVPPKSENKAPTVCSSDQAFEKDVQCICAPNSKKYFLREDRNVCLAIDQKVSECAVNSKLSNSLICHCPKTSKLLKVETDSFMCQDSQIPAETSKPNTEAKPKTTKSKKSTTDKKNKKK